MKAEAAELFSMYGDVKENYSGRGMFGKSTYAVVFDSDVDFFKCISDLIVEFVEDQNMDDAQLLSETLKKIRIDDMGKRIIYY